MIKKGYKQLLEEANAVVKPVTPAEAAALAEDEHAVLIDIRDIRELNREGRVEGARHCPRGMLEFWIDPESPYHKPLFAEEKTFIFFCAAGWRSALAAKLAQDMGLEPVLHIEGGFAAWREAGLDIIAPDEK